MASIGFTVPFTRSSSSLGLMATTTTDLAAAKENLRNLLLTNWGERPMHYDMGCNFREFLFQPMNANEIDVIIKERIRSQVSKWLPYLALNSINIVFPRDNMIRVAMSFFLISNPNAIDTIAVEVTA